MKNNTITIMLVAVLVLGLAAGYFINDYISDRRDSGAANDLPQNGGDIDNSTNGSDSNNNDQADDGQDSWASHTDPVSNITFRYPDDSWAYVNEQDWPPQVRVVTEPYSCVEAGTETDRTGKTERRVVDGREYCVTEITEGAAGSVYTQYAYTYAAGNQTVALSFSLRLPQCGNYSNEERLACERERQTMDLDGLVDQIAQTTGRTE